ncbi:hypothetical protein KY331_02745 [Candidatus Woesearchaeota archaeon]|nr:hypothetical protein [Candidatus Woesearchaeota archaeon]
MKKLFFILGLIAILFISGCTGDINLKSIEDLIGPISTNAISSGSCKTEISDEVEILQINVPSKITITLAALKEFDDVEDAKKYINNWKYTDAALADLKGDIEEKIEVGVVKVDKVSEAYTYAIVCIDGEVMGNSEKTLKKIS